MYSRQDLARVEKEAITALKWKLRRTTAVVFLHYYSDIMGRPGRSVIKLARAMLDMCLEQTWYVVEKILKRGSKNHYCCIINPGGWEWNKHAFQCTERDYSLQV